MYEYTMNIEIIAIELPIYKIYCSDKKNKLK